MSQNNGRAKRSEKGLLTPDNCVVAFIDHQPQMLFGVSNFDRQSIINNVVALAKATRIFDVPTVLSTVETKAFSGHMWPQLKAVFPGREPIERSSMNSWDDRNFVAAIEKTGRKKIVLCGLWTETCVALPTIQAIHDGYEVYVVEDCCGDVSQMAHDNAMRRVDQAGAKPVTALSTMLEWQRDWAHRDTYDSCHGYREESFRSLWRRSGICVHDGARRRGFCLSGVRGPTGRDSPQIVRRQGMNHPTADLILHNGKIATQDERRSVVEAVAIRDGKVPRGRKRSRSNALP